MFDFTNKTAAEIIEHFGSKSEAIRQLHHKHGLGRSEISKLLDIKYQHVRNVLITPTKSYQPQ